jgi:hypothetical protein
VISILVSQVPRIFNARDYSVAGRPDLLLSAVYTTNPLRTHAITRTGVAVCLPGLAALRSVEVQWDAGLNQMGSNTSALLIYSF